MEYKLKIDGMSCNACVKNITKIIQKFDNIKTVSVDLDNHSAKISTKNSCVLRVTKGESFSFRLCGFNIVFQKFYFQFYTVNTPFKLAFSVLNFK